MPARTAPPTRRTSPRISVLLADDHPVLREGVHCLLERQSDIRVVSSVSDGGAAIREAERLAPEVAVLDITMPGLDGIEATRVIADRMPRVAVLILSMHTSPIIVRRAMEAGASGYLAKDAVVDELVRAVRAVAGGKRYIGQGFAQSLLDGDEAARGSDRALDVLTAAERNILRLAAEGKSNAQIAAAISLSPRTVETYRLRLMRKLHIDDFASLVKFAIRHGITPLD